LKTKIFYFTLKNAGAVAVNLKVVGLAPGMASKYLKIVLQNSKIYVFVFFKEICSKYEEKKMCLKSILAEAAFCKIDP
jgi:hypothetical protein